MLFDEVYERKLDEQNAEYEKLSEKDKNLVIKNRTVQFYQKQMFQHLMENTVNLVRYGEQEGYETDYIYDFIIRIIKNIFKTNLYAEYFVRLEREEEFTGFLDDYAIYQRLFPFIDEAGHYDNREVDIVRDDIVSYFTDTKPLTNAINDINKDGFDKEKTDNCFLTYFKEIDLYYTDNGFHHLGTAVITKNGNKGSSKLVFPVREISFSNFYDRYDVGLSSSGNIMIWLDKDNPTSLPEIIRDSRLAALYKISEFKENKALSSDISKWINYWRNTDLRMNNQ